MNPKREYRILISRPDRIGDVVLSTAIPREIKKAFPNSYVAVLVRSYAMDVFVNNPHVDELLIADKILSGNLCEYISEVKSIRKFKFTHALMLLPNERINYLLFLAGVKIRIGVGHKFYQFITGVKSVSRNKYIPLRHEADYCMDLARKLGVKTENLSPEIYLSNEEESLSKDIRFKLLGDKKFLVGVHVTSGKSAPNWNSNYYLQLIKRLSEEESIRIVVTDNSVPDELSDIPGVSYPNKNKSLRESTLNFSTLDLLISASTGPMHICAALKVKTLSLFCPLTACSPKLWGPLGNDSKKILPGEDYCQLKCPGNPKNCTFEGEGGITVKQVEEEVKRLLSNR